jgi:acyl-CoA hydrolase
MIPADEALALIHSGQRVYIGSGCGVPTPLLEALVARAPDLRDVDIFHMRIAGDDPTAAPECDGAFRHYALFVGPNVRRAINEGRGDRTRRPSVAGHERGAARRLVTDRSSWSLAGVLHRGYTKSAQDCSGQ